MKGVKEGKSFFSFQFSADRRLNIQAASPALV
jgi:hypothetical protein